MDSCPGVWDNLQKLADSPGAEQILKQAPADSVSLMSNQGMPACVQAAATAWKLQATAQGLTSTCRPWLQHHQRHWQW